MVRAAQQVEQCFVVVFLGGAQGGQAQLQVALEVGCHKAFREQLTARQFVDDAGVLQQVACRPARCAQQVQQLLVHGRALQQQGQVALAAHQRFQPVDQAHGGFFAHAAVAYPLGGALYQAQQACTGFFAQCRHARVVAPLGHALVQQGRELFEQVFQFWRVGGAGGAAAIAAVAFFGFFGT